MTMTMTARNSESISCYAEKQLPNEPPPVVFTPSLQLVHALQVASRQMASLWLR
eukprot:m.283370 g.283370  ORF g.283370 m.283370 type:complete len:54 (+) comp54945_c0_seq1:648-809(+)